MASSGFSPILDTTSHHYHAERAGLPGATFRDGKWHLGPTGSGNPTSANPGTGAPAAAPGNAFSPEMLSGMYQQALQASNQDESNRQTGIQQSMNARGVAGPNVAAITAPGSLANRRGALAQGNLAAQTAGLNLGLGQYSAETGRQSTNNQAAQFASGQAQQQGQFNANLAFQQQQANQAQQNFQLQNQQQNPKPAPQNPFASLIGVGSINPAVLNHNNAYAA